MNEGKLLEGIQALISKCLDTKEVSTTLTNTTVVKSIDEEKQLFTAVVLRPDDIDSHGDAYGIDVVEKACHDYNKFCNQSNLQHLVQTDLVVPVESWISKTSHILGEGEVTAGDWVMTVEVLDNDIWEECKKGTFTGFSVGCQSLVETIQED